MTAEWTKERIVGHRKQLQRMQATLPEHITTGLEMDLFTACDIGLYALDTLDAQQAELRAARLVTDVFTEGYKAEVVEYNAEKGKVLLHLTYRQYQTLDIALDALRGEETPHDG